MLGRKSKLFISSIRGNASVPFELSVYSDWLTRSVREAFSECPEVYDTEIIIELIEYLRHGY